MKNELKKGCMIAALMASACFFAGCDKDAKTAPEAPAAEAAEKVDSVEASLQPTEMKVGETSDLTDAKDPKIWAFLPEVIAEVNGKKVTKGEFIDFFASQMPNGKIPQTMPVQMLPMAAPRMIKSYVDLPLIVAAVTKAGYTPSKEMIVKTIKEQFGKLSAEDAETFKAQLAAQNMTVDSYIDQFASSKQNQESFAVERYFDKEIISKINISAAEAEKFYNENKDMFKTAADPEGTVRASHILIGTEKGASAETDAIAKKRAEEVLAKLKKDPAKFAELAASESTCPSGVKGGDLGAFGKGQMVKPFEDAAFALKEGELSGIVKTDFGYHIILRTPSKKAEPLTFDKVKDGIISNLKTQQANAEFEKFIAKIEKENNVKFFVKEPAMPTAAPAPAPAK